jgi:hypothetical protein
MTDFRLRTHSLGAAKVQQGIKSLQVANIGNIFKMLEITKKEAEDIVQISRKPFCNGPVIHTWCRLPPPFLYV